MLRSGLAQEPSHRPGQPQEASCRGRESLGISSHRPGQAQEASCRGLEVLRRRPRHTAAPRRTAARRGRKILSFVLGSGTFPAGVLPTFRPALSLSDPSTKLFGRRNGARGRTDCFLCKKSANRRYAVVRPPFILITFYYVYSYQKTMFFILGFPN